VSTLVHVDQFDLVIMHSSTIKTYTSQTLVVLIVSNNSIIIVLLLLSVIVIIIIIIIIIIKHMRYSIMHANKKCCIWDIQFSN
jgi:hypothetical protein